MRRGGLAGSALLVVVAGCSSSTPPKASERRSDALTQVLESRSGRRWLGRAARATGPTSLPTAKPGELAPGAVVTWPQAAGVRSAEVFGDLTIFPDALGEEAHAVHLRSSRGGSAVLRLARPLPRLAFQVAVQGAASVVVGARGARFVNHDGSTRLFAPPPSSWTLQAQSSPRISSFPAAATMAD